METTKKQTLWEAKGMPDFGSYTALPTYFSNNLLLASKGISPQFWKFTTILWRELLAARKNPNPPPLYITPFQYKFTYEQLTKEFHIHSKAVARAVAAYGVSGFMSIKRGKSKTAKTAGVPTIFQYEKSTTMEEWGAFFGGLSRVCSEDRAKHLGGADVGFQVALAKEVRDQRKMGLEVTHFDSYLGHMLQAGIVDGHGRVLRKTADHFGLRTWDEKYNADPYRFHKEE